MRGVEGLLNFGRGYKNRTCTKNFKGSCATTTPIPNKNTRIVKASKLYGIEYSSLIFELGNRKLVAGQEDLILEVAQKIKENK